MGYAFLYGVFGSLIGSNLGATLYEKILKPVAPSSEAVTSGVALSSEAMSQVKSFWLIFAVLGIFCLAGMLLYNRFFSKDTPETNQLARKIMLGIYIVLALAGVYFFVLAIFLSAQVQWKIFVQALILLALGGGGIAISLKRSQ
jgi:hypothetical protein